MVPALKYPHQKLIKCSIIVVHLLRNIHGALVFTQYAADRIEAQHMEL